MSIQNLIDSGAITVDDDGTTRLTVRSWRLMTLQPALHFVGFKDDRYYNAVKVFGKPDFIHRFWDYRAVCEVAPIDTVIFADGDETQAVREYAYDDSAHF